MKRNRIIFIILTLLLITTFSNGVPTFAKSYTPEQRVVQAEALSKQLAPLINIEKAKKVASVSPTLIKNTSTALSTAKTSVNAMKKSSTKTKLEARLAIVQVTYDRAIYYNNVVGVGERMKVMTQTLSSAYSKNPASDQTEVAYRNLQAELGKFARTLGKVYGKSTREAISSKYKTAPEATLKQTNSAFLVKTEINKLRALLKIGINDASFLQIDKVNAQLQSVNSNSIVYHSFITVYENLLKEKGTSSSGIYTVIMKKIIASEQSVVYIETYDEDDELLSQGSGLITGKSTILTNTHLLQDAVSIVAYTDKGQKISIKGIARQDVHTDLTILSTVKDLTIPALTIGNTNSLEKGDPIVTVGSPEGLMNTLSTGIISNLHKAISDNGSTIELLQITAPITYGSSGGALFNKYGEVIGVTSAGYENGNLNFAVSIKHAEKWIRELAPLSTNKILAIPLTVQFPTELVTDAPEPAPVTSIPSTPSTNTESSETIPSTSGSISKTLLGVDVREAVMHPTKPIVYVLASGKDLYEINLLSKESRRMTFELPPERLFFANNEIYITLLKGEHSYYWWTENQEGAFAVVDAESFTLKSLVNITLDPFDIVADTESIYISGASGQWTNMKVFSRSTLLETGKVTSFRQGSFLEIHPEGGRIYSIDTDSSPRDVSTHQFLNGKRVSGYDSPYHGDYPLATNMNLSPDGQYLFNGSGVVFKASLSRQTDLTYLTKLYTGYTSIAFDSMNNRFYTSSKKTLTVYDYSNFALVKQYVLPHEIEHLFVQDRQLIAIFKETTAGTLLPKYVAKIYLLNEDGTIKASTTEITSPDKPPATINLISTIKAIPQVPVSGEKMFLPTNLRQEVMHPTEPILYGLGDGKDIIEYNLDTKQTRKISFALPPERLVLADKELYVAFKKPQSDQTITGMLAIVNTETFSLTKEVDIPIKPFDIAVNSQSIFVLNDNGYSWTNLKVYSKTTLEETATSGSQYSRAYLHAHPIDEKLYTIDIDVSPRDVDAFLFTNGQPAGTYDSPYHGDYSLSTNMKISPDGKLIFNGSGEVWQSSSIRDQDMKHVKTLYHSFEEIAFDLTSGRFYTSTKNGLNIYNYSTFEQMKHYEFDHTIDAMFVQNGQLIVTYTETPPDSLLPKKVVKKYPLTSSGDLTLQSK